tara:strand:- start:5482 stop:5730 length:249 start_codon:yes stop_codon:yes gene_type:complete
MTTELIANNDHDVQVPHGRRTLADDFREQADEDRIVAIAYFRQRIVEEQRNRIIAVYKSQLEDSDDRIARYQNIIKKMLEGK